MEFEYFFYPPTVRSEFRKPPQSVPSSCGRPVLQQYKVRASTFLQRGHLASWGLPVASQNGSAGDSQCSHFGVHSVLVVVPLMESRLRFSPLVEGECMLVSAVEDMSKEVCAGGVPTCDGRRTDSFFQ